MATKLKNLRIRKVDFVDEGANPDAHIGMMKRKDAEGRPSEENCGKEPGNILKKMFHFIGKAAGMNQSEIDSAVDEIRKGSSMSFTERINAVNNGKIADEMWDVCYALQSSLCSILNDEDMDSDSTAAAMRENLDEFYAVVQESIKEWSSGSEAGIVRKNKEVSEADLEIMKAAVERLNESIEKAGGDAKSKEESEEDEPGNNEDPKGDEEEMKIDKSRMTDAERAFLESLEKRYGTDDGNVPDAGSADGGTVPDNGEAEPAPGVTKSVVRPQDGRATQEEETDGIYKGLHPAVRAELEELKKFREKAEERELTEVAKKYAVIGKKEDELVSMFKGLKAAGGTAYQDMIAVLDHAVDTVEKSGVFGEIGKSGHGSNDAGAVEAKIDVIAKGYMEKDPSMNYTVAVAKAWENNPELLEEYEDKEGF